MSGPYASERGATAVEFLYIGIERLERLNLEERIRALALIKELLLEAVENAEADTETANQEFGGDVQLWRTLFRWIDHQKNKDLYSCRKCCAINLQTHCPCCGFEEPR
jgi:hypothetical protein